LTSALLTTLVVEVETLVVVDEVVVEVVVDGAVDRTATVSHSIVVVSAMITHVPVLAVATVNVHQTLLMKWTSQVWTRRWMPSKPKLGPRHDICRRWMEEVFKLTELISLTTMIINYVIFIVLVCCCLSR